ncbi:hypothetical protein V9T40_012744 [Parthenolecanium corni]|uniref:Cytochrome P450 n=1 Tax=Parthenolecanium corni TaxID=536013 RepID=A0AAN9TBN8_9HEMI
MDFMRQIWRRVGDVIFFEILGLPSVCLMAPEDIELVFNNSQHITKGLEYLTITPWLCEGLLTSTGTKWHLRRKMLTPTFHFKVLENYIPIFNRNAKLLTKKLSEQSEPVDIDAYISLCTLDVICETAMGTSLDFQLGEAADYVSAIRKTGEIILKRNLTFWMYKNWLFYLSPTGREFSRVVKRLHKFTENVIKERKIIFNQIQASQDEDENGSYKQRKSFLDCLLQMQRENPDEMTDEGIREEVDTFMFEGHDTTSVALTWALFMIAAYPEVQEKIREEIFSIFGDSDREATVQDLHQMKYLEMVFKETLRLYPSVPYISRWLIEDLQIKNYTIPAQTNVSIIPYLIHRNEKIYTDPEKFDPDRFSPDVAKQRHPYAYIPFSAGYRNCIGQKFATLEVKVILSTILRKLKLSTTMKKEDVKVLPQMILRPQPKVYISCSPYTK